MVVSVCCVGFAVTWEGVREAVKLAEQAASGGESRLLVVTSSTRRFASR